jgi:hypothetical protein
MNPRLSRAWKGRTASGPEARGEAERAGRPVGVEHTGTTNLTELVGIFAEHPRSEAKRCLKRYTSRETCRPILRDAGVRLPPG